MSNDPLRRLIDKWRGFASEPIQLPPGTTAEAALTWFNGRNRAYTACADEVEAALSVRVPEVPQVDAPLECKVRDGRLVISIGVDTLAFCAKESPDIYNMLSDPATGEIPPGAFRVVDAGVFAKEIVYALTKEEEDGSSPLTKLLDKATLDAIEDGCEGVRIKGDE